MKKLSLLLILAITISIKKISRNRRTIKNPIIMRTIFFPLLVFVFCSSFAQTTTQYTLTNGDGWYRIVEGGWQTSGFIKISGLTGNNRVTNITMQVSLMAYGQGGSINIINNSFYNGNHIDDIRAGTYGGKYVLDIHLVGIDNPSNISITTDSVSTITPLFNPNDAISGQIEISGRVIGISSTKYSIYFSEKVGIGTETPDAKLAVNGNIHTKEVKVDLVGWSDFVFDSDYNLPTLKSVEHHIKEKGHLKDIPSAEDVAKNGVFLGDMDSKLLQKIEELTLYTIDQEKRIENLEAQNKKLMVLLEKLVDKKGE